MNCTICQCKIRFWHKKYKSKCNHKFHLECANKWHIFSIEKNDEIKYKNSTCPNCRKKNFWNNPNSFLKISGY